MDEPEDSSPLGGVEAEIRELLGLFDVPAFARRGQDVEHSRFRLRHRLEQVRSGMLDMVRLRLKQWAAACPGPDLALTIFRARIDDLWLLARVPAPPWARSAESPRRLRVIGRDLITSVERFNRRWNTHLSGIDLEPLNGQIRNYNKYYVLEKECVLKSTRLAARNFVPKVAVTMDDLRAEHPTLPVPELR